MTAEHVATQYGITREAQDEFAAESQHRAACAIGEGVFRNEIVPVTVRSGTDGAVVVDVDEHPRSEATIERLRALKPAFTTDPGSTSSSSG